jgi:hypothetical protein
VDVSLGPKVIVLPPASQRPGRVLTIKDAGFCSVANTITIQTYGGDSFESGSIDFVMNIPQSFLTVIADADNLVWRFLATSIVKLSPLLDEFFVNNLSTVTLRASTISTYSMTAETISSTTGSFISLINSNLLTSSIVTNSISTDTLFVNSLQASTLSSFNLATSNINTSTLNAANISTVTLTASTIST